MCCRTAAWNALAVGCLAALWLERPVPTRCATVRLGAAAWPPWSPPCWPFISDRGHPAGRAARIRELDGQRHRGRRPACGCASSSGGFVGLVQRLLQCATAGGDRPAFLTGCTSCTSSCGPRSTSCLVGSGQEDGASRWAAACCVTAGAMAVSVAVARSSRGNCSRSPILRLKGRGWTPRRLRGGRTVEGPGRSS